MARKEATIKVRVPRWQLERVVGLKNAYDFPTKSDAIRYAINNTYMEYRKKKR